MNSKNTWLLLLFAALLAGFIFGWEKFVANPARQPLLVLPGFNSQAVTNIQLRVAGQPEILVVRANGGWELVKPLPCSAHSRNIELLLAALGRLKPETSLSPRELMSHPDTDVEFGFDKPQATLVLTTATDRKQIIIGARTAPGDQMFLEVAGMPGVRLISTNLLSYIPPTPSGWRNSELLDWVALKFDRLLVNQGTRTMELQRNATNDQWRLVRLQARADSLLVDELLKRLRTVKIAGFVTDKPGTDLDTYGLQTPELEMIFSAGTNVVAALQFGHSLTNQPGITNQADITNQAELIYARHAGSDSIFTVPADALKPWRGAPADYRDRHLVLFKALPPIIEVVGLDQFALKRQTNNLWHVLPQNFMADTNSMNDFILSLLKMEVVQFVKDVVIESALTNYGLAAPPLQSPRQYLLKTSADNTNVAGIHLFFGDQRDETVYARRADEDSVYAVKLADFNRLPAASWELRDRRIWHFTEDDVARVLVEQGGHKREMIRTGTNTWSLAPGSFGVINPFALEETVHGVGDLRAAFWTARGQIDRVKYGFTDPPYRVTFTLKDNTTRVIEFGGEAPSQFPYALVTLKGEPWLFEFPWTTWQYVVSYLSIPVRDLSKP